ncbi:hypothetical protein WICMUC_002228 [Wickerhamomyces mucosus]|uniref:Uncharacterized protein n=1 Tax=Wickerhamomyces mucosus TaxID=1378264 RepID=A0A9P8PPK6_9ASCO|nr:hypothetical protein WICMUC_002228 [Wickerhamomyces mucosus]
MTSANSTTFKNDYLLLNLHKVYDISQENALGQVINMSGSKKVCYQATLPHLKNSANKDKIKINEGERFNESLSFRAGSKNIASKENQKISVTNENKAKLETKELLTLNSSVNNAINMYGNSRSYRISSSSREEVFDLKDNFSLFRLHKNQVKNRTIYRDFRSSIRLVEACVENRNVSNSYSGKLQSLPSCCFEVNYQEEGEEEKDVLNDVWIIQVVTIGKKLKDLTSGTT